jgi:dTDP-glucose 4,6-dehydratase
MTKGHPGDMYNVGGENEMENIKLVELICDILDELLDEPGSPPRRELITFVKDRPGHDRRYAIDSGKITQQLHWRPKESFETGLRKTISWYLENQDWVNRVRSGEYQRWIKEHYGA